METFAPAYFDYMSSAVSANRPTLLAKVFGCYKLTFKKTGISDKGQGKSKQMNLLVMENLFYDRRFSKVIISLSMFYVTHHFQIYDLKGSTRNRHVQSTGRENEVLLDENLVQSMEILLLQFSEHLLAHFSRPYYAVLSQGALETYITWRFIQRQQVFGRYQCYGLFSCLRCRLFPVCCVQLFDVFVQVDSHNNELVVGIVGMLSLHN